MWQEDGAGRIARIGVLTPHLDPVPESELYTIAPTGVSVHTARVPLGLIRPDGEIIPHVGPEVPMAFAQSPALGDAAALLSPITPNAVIYAFTSSSYILGADADLALKARLEDRTSGVPVVIQSQSLVSALRALKCDRMALFRPPWFSTELDELGAEYFSKSVWRFFAHLGSLRNWMSWERNISPNRASMSPIMGRHGFDPIMAISHRGCCSTG